MHWLPDSSSPRLRSACLLPGTVEHAGVAGCGVKIAGAFSRTLSTSTQRVPAFPPTHCPLRKGRCLRRCGRGPFAAYTFLCSYCRFWGCCVARRAPLERCVVFSPRRVSAAAEAGQPATPSQVVPCAGMSSDESSHGDDFFDMPVEERGGLIRSSLFFQDAGPGKVCSGCRPNEDADNAAAAGAAALGPRQPKEKRNFIIIGYGSASPGASGRHACGVGKRCSARCGRFYCGPCCHLRGRPHCNVLSGDFRLCTTRTFV